MATPEQKIAAQYATARTRLTADRDFWDGRDTDPDLAARQVAKAEAELRGLDFHYPECARGQWTPES